MAGDKKKVVRKVKATVEKSDSKKIQGLKEPELIQAAKNEVIEKVDKPIDEQPTTSIAKPTKRTAKADKNKRRDGKKHFFLFAPFVALVHYLVDSWQELRTVQWPSRSATWKMTFAVIAFCLFLSLIVLLFDWLSQLLIQEVIL